MSSNLNLNGRIGMVFYPVPSLQHLAAISVDTVLWNHSDIRNLMENFRFQKSEEQDEMLPEMVVRWNSIGSEVREMVSLLVLPKLLQEKLCNFVNPIGLEIMKWKEFHELKCHGDINLPNSFSWNSRGTIDLKKTAEILVNDRNLNDLVRYKLACTYCLESHVRILWSTIPNELKNSSFSENPLPIEGRKLLPVFWAYIMNEAEINDVFNKSPDVSPLQFMFEHSVFCSNRAASEYFWQKLNPEEKKTSLERSAVGAIRVEYFVPGNSLSGEYHIEIILFLLSLMNEQQQTHIFEKYGCNVLQCFLNWPFQDLFGQMANQFWDVLRPLKYIPVLEVLTEKITLGIEDYNYRKLFSELWQGSPVAFKRCVMRECASRLELLWDLFIIGDKENIELIFKDASINEQQKIITFYNKRSSQKYDVARCALKHDEKEVQVKLLHFLKQLVHDERKT